MASSRHAFSSLHSPPPPPSLCARLSPPSAGRFSLLERGEACSWERGVGCKVRSLAFHRGSCCLTAPRPSTSCLPPLAGVPAHPRAVWLRRLPSREREGPSRTRHAAGAHELQGSVARNDAADSGPLISPHPQMSLEEAVEAQMQALAANDVPRMDHGLEVMYYFANAEGCLAAGPQAGAADALPRYFGCAADLYHFGHFALKFKTRFPQLINHGGFRIVNSTLTGPSPGQPESARVVVEVLLDGRQRPRRTFGGGHPEGTSSDGVQRETWEMGLSKIVRGIRAPCWLTDFIRIIDG